MKRYDLYVKAKCLKTGKYVVGFYEERFESNQFGLSQTNSYIRQPSIFLNGKSKVFLVDPRTILKYTGEKDKEGFLIFES